MSGFEKKGNSGKSFEAALKEVFNCHRDLIRECRAELKDYKQKYENLEQDYQRFVEEDDVSKKETDELKAENRNLKNLVDELELKSSGKCSVCSQLQHSLNALQEAYKQSLQEKDKLIKYLEGRITDLSDESTGNKRSPNKQRSVVDPNTPLVNSNNQNKRKASPDSTSVPVEQSILNVCQQDEVTTGNDNNSDKSPKLRLHRGKHKRSRYMEDEVQDVKKHKLSPTKSNIDDSSDGLSNSSKASALFLSVFIPDTCYPDTESSPPSLKKKKFKAGQKISDNINIVVPETVDVQEKYCYSSSSENEHMDTVETKSPVRTCKQFQYSVSVLDSPLSPSDKECGLTGILNHNTLNLSEDDGDEENGREINAYKSDRLAQKTTRCGSQEKEGNRRTVSHSNERVLRKKYTRSSSADKCETEVSTIITKENSDDNVDVSDVESPSLLRISSKVDLIHSRTTQKSQDKTEDCDWLSCEKPNVDVTETEKKRVSNQKLLKCDRIVRRSLRSNNSLFFTEKTPDEGGKNLRQTTLSQAFVSSPKQKRKSTLSPKSKEECEINEAIRRSLKEIQNTEKCLTVVVDSPEKHNNCDDGENTHPAFKIPLSPNKYSALHISPKNKHYAKPPKVSEPENSDLDETLAPTCPQSKHLCEQSMDTVKHQHCNGSLDPDLRLTQLCSEIPNENTEISDRVGPTTSTLLLDDDIPSTARSYKFGSGRKKAYQINHSVTDSQNLDDLIDEESQNLLAGDHVVDGNTSINDSFDRLPKKASVEFAHVDVVRKKDEREKLKGHDCRECLEYYKSAGLTDEEMSKRMQKCSRHRAKYIPPDTPEHFWSIGFPDTPECIERGYMRTEEDVKPSSFRRRRKLERKFKSKTESSQDEDD